MKSILRPTRSIAKLIHILKRATRALDCHITERHGQTMRRVFQTRHFACWMRKTGLTNLALCKAVVEMAGGLIDADLEGDVLKKRVALPGRGKSGGVRTLVAPRRGTKWVLLFGFEKGDRANISDVELEGLQLLASDLLARTNRQRDQAIAEGAVLEICHDYKIQGEEPTS